MGKKGPAGTLHASRHGQASLLHGQGAAITTYGHARVFIRANV
jgi:hypothetical protein